MRSTVKSNVGWEVVEASQDFLKLVKMKSMALVTEVRRLYRCKNPKELHKESV